MFYIDFAVISDPEHGKAADLILAIGADRGSGVSDQAAGVDQADFAPLRTGVPELMCVPEDDQVGVPDSGTARKQADVRNIVFLAVGHQNAADDIFRTFECMRGEREAAGQLFFF